LERALATFQNESCKFKGCVGAFFELVFWVTFLTKKKVTEEIKKSVNPFSNPRKN